MANAAKLVRIRVALGAPKSPLRRNGRRSWAPAVLTDCRFDLCPVRAGCVVEIGLVRRSTLRASPQDRSSMLTRPKKRATISPLVDEPLATIDDGVLRCRYQRQSAITPGQRPTSRPSYSSVHRSSAPIGPLLTRRVCVQSRFK